MLHHVLFTAPPGGDAKEIRRAIETALDAALQGHPLLFGISGGASEADILFQEACIARGIASEIYLTLPLAKPTPGPEWDERFNAVLRERPFLIVPDARAWMLARAQAGGEENMTALTVETGSQG
jgi:hypothetical protein